MNDVAPLPWKAVPWHIEEGPPAVRDARGDIVCTTASDATAEFIVKAANNEARLTELEAALEWYAEKARALSSNDWKERPHIAEAIFTELQLDGGNRARTALKGDGE